MKTAKNQNTPIRQQRALGRTPNVPNTHPTRARVSPIVPSGEKTLEAKLRKEVEKMGGMAVKLTSQLHRGLPDRLILMPGGHTHFVEVKTTGKRPTGLQASVHRDLRRLGFDVYVIDSTAGLQDFVLLLGDEQAFDKVQEML